MQILSKKQNSCWKIADSSSLLSSYPLSRIGTADKEPTNFSGSLNPAWPRNLLKRSAQRLRSRTFSDKMMLNKLDRLSLPAWMAKRWIHPWLRTFLGKSVRSFWIRTRIADFGCSTQFEARDRHAMPMLRFMAMLAFLCLPPRNTGMLLTIVLHVGGFPQADDRLQLECLAEPVGFIRDMSKSEHDRSARDGTRWSR